MLVKSDDLWDSNGELNRFTLTGIQKSLYSALRMVYSGHNIIGARFGLQVITILNEWKVITFKITLNRNQM